MTPQEVIDILKMFTTDEFQRCTSSEFDDAIYVAIEALEKQIPEMPDYEGDGYADGELIYDTWVCPSCGRHYEIDYDHYVYCPECGQLINWDSLEKIE